MRILSFSAGMDVPAVNSLDYCCKKKEMELYVRSILFVSLGRREAPYPVRIGRISDT